MISDDSLQPNTFGSLFLELASCHKGEEVSCLRFRAFRVKVQYLKLIEFASNLLLWIGVGTMLLGYLVGQVRSGVDWFWFLLGFNFWSNFFY
jgi:hypothetical protein